MAVPHVRRRHCRHRPLFFTRNVLVAMLLAGALGTSAWARPASVPSSALLSPSGAATVDGGNESAESLLPGLSTPVSGHISFRTKTRHGVRGLLPKPPRLGLWGKSGQDEGLDATKRFLHVTTNALVLEVEGEDECLSISRGPESAGGALVSVVSKADAGIDRRSSGYVTTIPVDGLFGVYDLLSGPFVAVIRRSKLRYAKPELGVEFRQVSKVRLIPVLASPKALDDGEAREEARLLGLLALAFRSHQFYFSHAHDVTQTLQSLRVSASSTSSDVPINSAQPSAITAAAAAEQTKGSIKKKHRGHRGWRGRSVSKGGHALAAKTAKLARPPPDPRFFWNLGVVGPLLELRERLGGEVGDDGAKGGETAPSADAVVGGEGGAGAVAAVDRWLSPVMSGFLQVERGCRVGEKSFDVLFVSRRSRLRQGTRFTRRGIDDSGNVANFVETEQSLLHEDQSVTSHVQIRGSIPVLWSSPTNLRYHPKVQIDPDQEASLRALRRHSEDLIQLYGKKGGGIVFVNLVDKKKEQGALGEAFDAALKAVADGAGRESAASGADKTASGYLPEGGGVGLEADTSSQAAVEEEEKAVENKGFDLADSLRHVWFDFHHECRNMHWENLDKLLAIVDREFGEQGFYHAGPGGETLSLQDGVVRTNCMDCLDRTNVVQSLLARRSMLVQLHAVGVDVPDPEGGNSTALALTLDMLEMPAEELEKRFRDLWGNNADEISMLYAGTPALKGDFTRTGHRTKMGLLQDGTNSAIRYVVNNFQDHRRQEAVDLLLGVHRPSVDSAGNVLNDSFKEPLDLDLWTTRLTPHSTPREAMHSSSSSFTLTSASTEEDPSLSRSGVAHDSSPSSYDDDGDNDASEEEVMSVGLGDSDVRKYRTGARRRRRPKSDAEIEAETRRGAGAEGAGKKVSGATAVVGAVGEVRGAAAVVERTTGAALTELRMAGPYSALALTALLVMAFRGGDLLSSGYGDGLRITTLLLLAGLVSLPVVLPLLETR